MDVPQAEMVLQVGRRAWPSVPAEVGGRCDRPQGGGGQAAGDQREPDLARDADREVEVLLDQVDLPVHQRDVHDEFGMGFAETCDQRAEVAGTEHHRRTCPQHAADLFHGRGREFLGGIDLRGDRDAAIQVVPSGIGEVQAPCRALQQPGSEVVLEFAHQPRGRGRRQAEPLRGARDAGGVDHLGEYPPGEKTIHAPNIPQTGMLYP
jgi:hypothetical protein